MIPTGPPEVIIAPTRLRDATMGLTAQQQQRNSWRRGPPTQLQADAPALRQRPTTIDFIMPDSAGADAVALFKAVKLR